MTMAVGDELPESPVEPANAPDDVRSALEFGAGALWIEGADLRKLPLTARKAALEKLIGKSKGPLRFLSHVKSAGDAVLEAACNMHWEGVVSKRQDAPYQSGRSGDWLKSKCRAGQEVVIGGWRTGDGGRSSGIGALLVGIPAEAGLRFAGRVGTGFSEKDLARLKDLLAPLRTDESPFETRLSGPDAKGVSYVRPELVGEVRYSEWTSDGRLRHPSWRGLRPDKQPADVVREVPV